MKKIKKLILLSALTYIYTAKKNDVESTAYFN